MCDFVSITISQWSYIFVVMFLCQSYLINIYAWFCLCSYFPMIDMYIWSLNYVMLPFWFITICGTLFQTWFHWDQQMHLDQCIYDVAALMVLFWATPVWGPWPCHGFFVLGTNPYSFVHCMATFLYDLYALVSIFAVMLCPYLFWPVWALAVVFITVMTLLQPVVSIGWCLHHLYDFIATVLIHMAVGCYLIAVMATV